MGEKTVEKAPEEKSLMRVVLSGFPIGVAFGTALEKSKVFLPEVIRGQMTMDVMIMMKVFLTATSVGMVSIAFMESKGWIKRSSKSNSLGLGYLNGMGGNALGGWILGTGIAICGSCPGTVLVQVAGGRINAIYTFIGGIAGAFSFGYIHKFIKGKNPSFMLVRESSSLDKDLKRSYLVTACAVSIAIGVGLYFLESYYPWQSEAAKFITNFDSSINGMIPSIFSKVWSPYLSGIVIGALQIPSYLLMGVALGTSSSYVSIAAQGSKAIDKNFKSISYFQGFVKSSDFYQVSLVAGIMTGSFASRYLSQVTYSGSPVSDFSPIIYFLGGFSLLIGARLAGGCTSGHGISGIARLANSSVITAACMFAGGISFAMLAFR